MLSHGSMAIAVPDPNQGREAAGYLVALGFVCLAAVRDVYLGGAVQQIQPALIAMVAFSLCTVVFSPAVLRSGTSIGVFRSRPGDLLWVNFTSAGAWIAYLFSLKLIEPTIVQILYSGIGPLSIVWIERHLSTVGKALSPTQAERFASRALLASLMLAAAIVPAGLSGVPDQPIGESAIGVALALGGGVLISASTMLCRKLNDAGATPSAVLALRYPMMPICAAVVVAYSPAGLPSGLGWIDVALGVAVLLIIVPSYVNQVAISLASPLTVRVVLAVGPVLIFLCQLIEGRLAVSPYSLLAAVLYGCAAISAAFARRRVIQSTSHFPDIR
jgi:drug/metabolite transporter (DMT)-like permease